MDLKQLIEHGAFINEGVTKKSVTWEGHTFDVLIKNEMSSADMEFVYGVGTRRADVNEHDESYAARRVHRFVRIGDKGQDAVPYEDAVRMKSALLIAICQKINEVHGKDAEPKN